LLKKKKKKKEQRIRDAGLEKEDLLKPLTKEGTGLKKERGE